VCANKKFRKNTLKHANEKRGNQKHVEFLCSSAFYSTIFLAFHICS
jgi:hypothetical protein